MELILTADRLGAVDAERAGLVSKVFPVDQVVNEAVKTAEKIASFSKVTSAMCKEAVNKGMWYKLCVGLLFLRYLVLSKHKFEADWLCLFYAFIAILWYLWWFCSNFFSVWAIPIRRTSLWKEAVPCLICNCKYSIRLNCNWFRPVFCNTKMDINWNN